MVYFCCDAALLSLSVLLVGPEMHSALEKLVPLHVQCEAIEEKLPELTSRREQMEQQVQTMREQVQCSSFKCDARCPDCWVPVIYLVCMVVLCCVNECVGGRVGECSSLCCSSSALPLRRRSLVWSYCFP